ncbi:MAG TPA: ATP-binding protein [Polyangiaceae bacterium]|nr:ATP-binding protein [Polyangiaceae bacterium]
MSTERESEPEGLLWREVLLQRVLVGSTPIIAAAILMALLNSQSGNRWWLGLLLPCIPLQIAAALNRTWSVRTRAAILILPLVLAVYITYLRVGFHGNSSLVAAAAVVLTGLFFGRRSMGILIGVLLLAPLLAAVGMTTGRLTTDAAIDVALDRVQPWIRTTFVSLSIWIVLGLAVTFVVQSIEGALSATRDALRNLRREEQRREQAERERLEAQEAALQAQKMEIVGRLAASVAHDMNNLLGVVAGWTGLMADETAGADERLEARGALDAVVQQGSALTRQLLALARRDSRVVSRVALEAAAASAVSALKRVLPLNVNLTFRQLTTASVNADATEIQQILFNLILNARDAMPDGGSIQVTTGVETFEAPFAVVGGTLAAGQWAALRVKDSGCGIEPAVRERIFELFFTTKEVGAGTGLGLATVLRIANASGGGVALDTTPGQGSTFTLYVPSAS